MVSGRPLIISVSADSKRLLLFDFQTEKWTEIANGNFGWQSFSDDGRFLQFLDVSGTTAVFRFYLSNHKMERVVDLKIFAYIGYYPWSLVMAPDGSPLLLRSASTSDVYALDWEEP